ncbi:hypothetical protein DVH05_017068 [Phytophthora capsici]|nr:hypothetical protein DVH05_017068 [Phytophthora capsici]
MSETELLRKKATLLSELHGVVSLEARIIQDDQCSVRSSVSSWKSSDYTCTPPTPPWRQPQKPRVAFLVGLPVIGWRSRAPSALQMMLAFASEGFSASGFMSHD